MSTSDIKSPQIAPERIEQLARAEAHLFDLKGLLVDLKASMEALEHGYRLEGLDGSNEKQREAYLAFELSQDPKYVELRGRYDEARINTASAEVEVNRLTRLHRLDLVMLGRRDD